MEMRDEETLVDELQEEAFQEEEESLLDQLGLEDHYDDSLNMMRTLAKKGDQRAILWMGMYYMQGGEAEQDFAEACYWFDKSNDAVAKAQMAKVYEREGNKELAIHYYQEAVEAEEDSEGTMKGLSYLSLTMLWLPEDVHEAEYNFIQLLESDLPDGLEGNIPKIADVLGKRLFLEKDYEACLAWTRVFLKYEPYDEDGRKRLLITAREGMKAEEGSTFFKNALEGLEELANLGNYQALVLVYAHWDGKRDEAESKEKYREWLIKAADAGVEPAQYDLALEYLLPQNIKKTSLPLDIDKSEAYFEKCRQWVLTLETGSKRVEAFTKMLNNAKGLSGQEKESDAKEPAPKKKGFLGRLFSK